MEIDGDIESSIRCGSILQVHVENFVTYSNASMFPGPHLNLIIGSNGTGKSTMVAAIILGLGGSPKHVGRGTRVSEYVKHHCTDSKIETTLYDSSKFSKKVVITREFNLQDKTVWKIDNKKVSLSDVNEYKKKFNIQVDNLCQFLPQDRVQEFSKLNKQELLKQTQIALCRDDLIEKQGELIKTTDEYNNQNKNLEKNIERLQAAKDANIRIEGKVTNFKKKKKYVGYIKDIDRKIAWKEYENVTMKREELKEDRAKAKEAWNKHKSCAAPTEVAISSAKQTIQQMERKINSTEKATKVVEENILNYISQVKSLKDDINNQKRRMESRLEQMRQRSSEIQNYTRKIEALNADKDEVISKYGNEEMIGSTVAKRNGNIKKILMHVNQLESKQSEVISLKQDKIYEKRGLENQLQQIENIKQQRLEFLRNMDPGTYKAVMWLRENQLDFVGQVYEPMILELNVINPKHALYIENIVSKRDKVAFICTEKQDMNLLIRVLRDQQNFSVNVLHSEDREDQALSIYQPKVPIEQLRKYGMFAYLNTLITGPRAVMKYLCKNYRIHQIPIGDESTNGCCQQVPAHIRLFFSDKNRFSISYSKYTNQKISKQNRISSDGSLSISVDGRKLAQIRSKLEECNCSYDRLLAEEQAVTEKIGKMKEVIEKEKEAIKEVREANNQIHNIESKMRIISQTLAQFQSENEDEDHIKAETNRKIQELVANIFEIQPQLLAKYEEFNSLLPNKNLMQMQINCTKQHMTYLQNKIIDIRHASDEAEQLFNDLSRRYNTLTDEAKQALHNAKKLSEGFTPDDKGFEQFREMHERLPEDLDSLAKERETLQSKIGCLTAADDDEILQYERRLHLIEKLEEEINMVNANADKINERIDKLERDYLGPLGNLVSEINRRFSSAYKRMGCVGEVDIYKGDNAKNYSNYGISVKVSYRSGEPLQELNSLTQSGGEKAVATATYMLSLQELTPVPFRCVDEINQGMDETNERRIFHLLTDSTSQPDTAQYFLVTPKLIPKLKYVPTMKIHCVHNGPFMKLN